MNLQPIEAVKEPKSSSARCTIRCYKCKNGLSWNEAAAKGWTWDNEGPAYMAYYCEHCSKELKELNELNEEKNRICEQQQ